MRSRTHRQLRRLLLAAVAGGICLVPGQAHAAAGRYSSPFAGDRSYITKRTDMGVDFCMRRGEPVRALGDGVVLGISRDWFTDPHNGFAQPYLWYRLTDGPHDGAVVYVAEQIRHLAHVGQRVRAGQPVAYYAKAGTCIETGWAAPKRSSLTLAQATTGYHEGEVTAAGVSFARFLSSLGVHGPFELSAHTKHQHRSRHKRADRDGLAKLSFPS